MFALCFHNYVRVVTSNFISVYQKAMFDIVTCAITANASPVLNWDTSTAVTPLINGAQTFRSKRSLIFLTAPLINLSRTAVM